MQNSTKKILDELYEISPSLKNEKNLKSLIVFMQHHKPNVKPSKAFKNQLWKKITTIADFKQIQPKQKFNPMVFLTPIFLMVFAFQYSQKYYASVFCLLYTQILWTSIIGLIFFNELLNNFAFFGALIIVLSGIISVPGQYKQLNE